MPPPLLGGIASYAFGGQRACALCALFKGLPAKPDVGPLKRLARCARQ